MTNSIQRDLKKRRLFSQYEISRLELQSLIANLNLPNELRTQFIGELNRLPRNSSRVRFKNRCILTGRGRSVYRFCKLSRLEFRRLAAQGNLLGITKSSW